MMYYNHFCVEKINVGNALLAQLVEHLTLNQGVQGSRRATKWRFCEWRV